MQQTTDTECHQKQKYPLPNKTLKFSLSEKTKDLRTKFEVSQNPVGRCVFTLDTGSEVSIIKISALKPNTICTKEKILLVGLENTIRIKTLGQTNLTIIKDNTEFSYKFHITKKNIGITTDGIIGLDFLRDFYGNICLRVNLLSLAVYHKPKSNKLLTVEEILNECLQETPDKPKHVNKISNIFMPNAHEQIIPPFTQTTIKVHTPTDMQEDAVCLRTEAYPGVLIGDSIVNKNSPRVAIINTNSVSVRLNTNKLQLQFHPISKYKVLGITENKTNNQQERRTTILHNLRLDHCNSEEKQIIEELVSSFSDIFYIKGDKLTHTDLTQHRIPIKENTNPIYTRQYRIPQSQQQELDKQIADLHQQGIIEPSFSPWNSPLIIVKKKDDRDGNKQFRLVVDFRNVNEVTAEQTFPIPLVEEILDLLGGSKYFSTLDLHNAYYQIQLHKDDRKFTAFQTNRGKFQFTKMAMGLKSSAMTWQQAINIALASILGTGAYSYLDDIIIYAETLEKHIKKLKDVFTCLRTHKFKLKIEKSNFLNKEISYLGHIVSEHGTKPDPEKMRAIHSFPQPKTVNEMQRFLGCCNYYRKYIKNYANITRPLSNLTKKEAIYIWTENCEEAFTILKKALTSEPLLIFPNFKEIFIVTCDASDVAIGAVLSQGIIPNDKPVQFYSKTLNETQTRYPTIEKELMAIVMAVENFRHYLYGRRFIIYTDHRPLLYIMKNKKPSSRLFRWKIALLEFNFDIYHKDGKQNVVADALSRITLNDLTNTEEEKNILITTRSTARQETKNNQANYSNRKPTLFIEEKNNVLFNSKDINQIYFLFNKIGCELQLKLETKLKEKIPRTTKTYTLYSVHEDYSIIIIPALIRNNEQIDNARMVIGLILEDAVNKGYEDIALNLDIKDAQSYFTFKSLTEEIFSDQGISVTFYINKICELTDINDINLILDANHKTLLGGHSGIERMLNKIKRFYSWPNMKKDVQNYVQNCEICEKTKIHKHTKTPIQIAESASKPFERVYIDLIGPITPASENGHKYIFTCECELTKFSIAVPIIDATAMSTSQAFLHEVLLKYLIPEYVIMDNGTNFTSELFTNLNKLLNIGKRHITAFNPKANTVERLHKTLNSYLRAFTKDDPNNWDQYIAFAMQSYNCTPHTTTKYAPQELLFGTLTQIPTKITKQKEPIYTYDNYIDELRTRLKYTHDLAKERLMTRKINNAEYKNQNTNQLDLEIGDNVLITKRNKDYKWDNIYEGPFKIVEILSPVAVKIKKGQKTQTILRDHLIKANIQD